jgi:hypothetical protein
LDHGCCGRSEPPVQDLGAAPAVAKGLEHRVIRRYPFRYASVSTRRHVLNQPQTGKIEMPLKRRRASPEIAGLANEGA